MGILATIAQASKQDRRCALAERLAALEGVDDDDWAFVKDASHGVPRIQKTLAAAGVIVSSTTISAHRNGTCLCTKGA